MDGNNYAEFCPLRFLHIHDWVIYKGDAVAWRIQLGRLHHSSFFGEDRIRERGGTDVAELLAARVRSDTCTDHLPSGVV